LDPTRKRGVFSGNFGRLRFAGEFVRERKSKDPRTRCRTRKGRGLAIREKTDTRISGIGAKDKKKKKKKVAIRNPRAFGYLKRQGKMATEKKREGLQTGGRSRWAAFTRWGITNRGKGLGKEQGKEGDCVTNWEKDKWFE